MEPNPDILTKQSFSLMVEELVHSSGMSYMEAILHICDERNIDPSDVGKVVSPSIRSKLEIEAQNKNLLPKSSSASLEDLIT